MKKNSLNSSQHITLLLQHLTMHSTKPPSRIREIIELLPTDVTAEYDAKIIRGFDYYTGMVFEIYAKDKKIASRSVTGGGRYDTLIEAYGGNALPAVGFGMGDVVLLDCLEAYNIAQTNQNTTTIMYVTNKQSITKGVQMAEALRQHTPVSFIGTVDPKKVTATYKYYDQKKHPDMSSVCRTVHFQCVSYLHETRRHSLP